LCCVELPGGYVLVKQEAGWDSNGGDIQKSKTPRGSELLNQLKYCVGKCKYTSGCTGFTLHMDACWLKDQGATGSTAVFKGQTTQGWRWYYVKQGGV
jgi:hypothetical protein